MNEQYGCSTTTVKNLFFAPVFEGLGVPAPDTVSLIVTTLVVSYLSLVLGELVPKRLALQRSVGVAKLFAPPLGKFATVMTPVIWLLSLSTNLLVRLLGGNPDAAGDEVDEEELRMMISGHEDIPEGERRLVDDVFEAGDRSLSEVMKPRGDVVFLRGDMSLAEAVAVINKTPTKYMHMAMQSAFVGDGTDDGPGPPCAACRPRCGTSLQALAWFAVGLFTRAVRARVASPAGVRASGTPRRRATVPPTPRRCRPSGHRSRVRSPRSSGGTVRTPEPPARR